MTSLKDIACCKCGCLKKFSNGIVAGLERLFYKLGGVVARHPWKTIGVCVLICTLMGAGLYYWDEETEYLKVWLPRGSRMRDETDWVRDHFPERIRFESVVVEDENVLTPQSISAMLDIYETARDFRTSNGGNLTSFCIKSGPICRVNSILELWLYSAHIIRNLTQDDILAKVNEEKLTSPLYQNEVSLERLLGNIQRDGEGQIVGAQATTMFWFLERNKTSEQYALEWEKKLIDLANDVGHQHLNNLYIYTARTFNDEAMGALASDMNLLTIGFSLVYLYLAVSIGKFSLIHHKVLLAAAGLLSIGMCIVFTYGFGFLTGIMFGPIHQILPFMLLGIGVDDIFVIMESLNHLTEKEKSLPLDARIATTLKHAGVSITVTSVTDIVAFAIGSSTVIPSLCTFCIYAAIGVFALYILQSTFFVACLTLDERRKDTRHDACVLCYRHRDTYQPNEYYTFSVQHQVMKKVWGPTLTKMPVKVGIILLTVALTSVNVWSFIQLKNDFDPSMYIPSDSYSLKYIAADRQYFPDDGDFVQLYCGEGDYANNVDTLLNLYENVRQMQSVQTTTVDFWLASYVRWLEATGATRLTIPYEALNNNSVPYDTSDTTTSIDDIITSVSDKATSDDTTYTIDTTDADSDDSITVKDTTTSGSKDPKFASNKATESIENSTTVTDNETTDVSDKLSAVTKDPQQHLLNKQDSTTTNTVQTEHQEDLNKTESQQNIFSENSSNDTKDATSNSSSVPSAPSKVVADKSISPSFLLSDSMSQTQSLPFLARLGMFLQTPQGRVYYRAIQFDSMTMPTKIMGSMMTFRHIKCQTSKCSIDAMDEMRELVDAFTFRGGGTCFVYSDRRYMFNETNKVLKLELYRNLALAAVCVFVVTLILITNIWTSMLVFIGVVCTVIDVAGTMQFWGITIDTASSVILILCFGLAVDYSAHIGHSFMTRHGSKNERLQKTLISMGPAVFSGGFSTFLAFLLLVKSTSYGFTLFFKIFTSVVIFGLFHGLAFLPVILSIIGPPPYETQDFHTPENTPSENGDLHDDINGGGVLANGRNGEAMALRDLHFEEYEGTAMTPNGHLSVNGHAWHGGSAGDLEDDPTQKLNENNPRYSGSYYEQMSNGSLVQIPFPGPQ